MKNSSKLIVFVVLLSFFGIKQTIADVIMHPFMTEKTTRTPGQLIQDIRGGKSLVKETQFLERLKLQGFKLTLLDELTDPNRVETKDCDWTVTTSPSIEFVGARGEFGVHGRACIPGEKILWVDGRPAISLYCGNIIHSLIPVTAPPNTVKKTNHCVWKNDQTIEFSTEQGFQPWGGLSLNSGNIIGGLSNHSGTRTQSGKTCISNQ